MRVLLPEDALVGELGEVPAGVELAGLPVAGPLPDGAQGAEFLVASFELRRRQPEAIPQLPALRVVQSLHAGVEALVALVPPGVALCNASGVHDGPVAEWVVAAVLALYRRFPQFLDAQRDGRWAFDPNASPTPEVGPLEDLDGKSVLVLGHGAIGRALEARLSPFGATVRGVARTARPGVATLDALPELLPAADAVVLLLPLTPETEGLVDARFLGRMKDGALLVNAARGRLVDQDALVEALAAGRIRAAADATDPEPLPPGHPLWSAPNLLLTPHVAGSVEAWRARAYRFVGEQLRRYARGEPLANVRHAY